MNMTSGIDVGLNVNNGVSPGSPLPYDPFYYICGSVSPMPYPTTTPTTSITCMNCNHVYHIQGVGNCPNCGVASTWVPPMWVGFNNPPQSTPNPLDHLAGVPKDVPAADQKPKWKPNPFAHKDDWRSQL